MSSSSDILAAEEPPEPRPPKGFRAVGQSKGVAKLRQFILAVLYRLFRLGGELTAVVLGLGIAASWMATSVLDRQSTDLSILRPNIKIWFADIFEGRDTEFGRLDLTWLPSSNQFVITIEDAEVLGADGQQLRHFDLIRTTLAMNEKRLSRPKLVNAEIKGGVLSYLEDENGLIIAGLGLPDTVGQFGPVYRNDDASDSKYNFSDIVQGLEFIQISDAVIYIQNDVSGVDLKSNVN